MISKILSFELKYRLSKPISLLLFLSLVFQAIWYTKGNYDLYTNDEQLMNAAGTMYQNMAGGGIIMMIIVAIITGTVIFKDIEFKTAQTFYSFPLNDKTFFLGKFFSAYLINIIICTGLIVGMCLVQYTGLAPANKIGPVPFWQILHGFLIFIMPNLFLLTAMSIFCIVHFRSMAAGYLGVFVFVMFFLIAEGTRESSRNEFLSLALDPFGFGSAKTIIDAATVIFKNAGYLSLSGILLVNRLIWFSVAIILFILSYY